MRWWDIEVRSRRAYAVAGALGLLVFLIVYGPGHLLGTASYWDMPQEDSRAYLMGYRYFLREPWHWPLFTTYTINLPDPKSFSLSDGIPIWALINKLIATVVPPWADFSERAYLGTWHALSHVLQACLGVAIVRLFNHRTYGAAIIAAIFFLAIPAWSYRYMHAALSAHFLILWALYLYLRTPPNASPSRRLQLVWLGELAVASMVNPYHIVMSFGLFVAALVRTRKLRALVWLPAALATILITTWLTGYLSRAAATRMTGYESFSTNITSMFVPSNSAILGDARWWFGDAWTIVYQYEGLMYIGLGLVALFVMFLPRAASLRGVIARHPELFVLALGAWCLALSTRVFFNSHLVFQYELPERVQFLTQWFRAPGRFGYLPMYVLIVFLLQWGFARFTAGFSGGWRGFVLPGLAVVQLVDATEQWGIQRAYTSKPYTHVLEIEPWRKLVHAHTKILELPTFDCVAADKLHAAMEIAYFASDRVIPINGVYGARPVRDCVEDKRQFPTVPVDGTLYVWFTNTDRFARKLEALGARCGRFQFGWACSKDDAAIADALAARALEPMTPTPPPLLAVGQTIEFGKGGTPIYLTDGWSYEEPGGRWSEGPVSSLRFRMAGELSPRVWLKFDASTVICRKRRKQDLEVSINDMVIGVVHFDRSNNEGPMRSIEITDLSLLASPEVFVDFKPRDVRSPFKLRCNADARAIGVWFRKLSFEAEP